MTAVRKSARKVVKFDDSVDKCYRAKFLALISQSQKQAINYTQPQLDRQLDAHRMLKLRRIYDPVYELVQEVLNKCLGDTCVENEHLTYSGLEITTAIQLQTVDINFTRKCETHPRFREYRIRILPPNGKTFIHEQSEYKDCIHAVSDLTELL